MKALRYHGISDMTSANVYAEEFLEEYNLKFAKPAKNPLDMHRALTDEEKEGLDKLFSIQTKRVISKDLLVRHENTIYKINEPEQVRRLRQAQVLVCENINGQISIYHQDKALNYEVYRKHLHVDQLLNRAGVNSYLNRIKYLSITFCCAHFRGAEGGLWCIFTPGCACLLCSSSFAVHALHPGLLTLTAAAV